VIAATALGATNAPAFAGASISGTAAYRERMLLPPGAVFEATLENVSRADAPAEVARASTGMMMRDDVKPELVAP